MISAGLPLARSAVETCRTPWATGKRAASALHSVGFSKVVQRASDGTGRDNRAWDGLMEAAQRGEASAYHRLLSEVAIWLRRYFGRRLPPVMIDDAVQDTLIAPREAAYLRSEPAIHPLARCNRALQVD